MAAENVGADMFGLPENCIANVLSLTTPKDTCRLSLVASKFRSAAQSDVVWERFLPPDYRDLVSRAANSPHLIAFTSKKELYFHLCDHHTIIDNGTKSFSLEKGSGKICYMFSARSLEIAWGNDTRYWEWVPLEKSRFSIHKSRFCEAAELRSDCWLEICLKMSTKMLSPGTKYAAYLVFIVVANMKGFRHQPVEASVRVKGQQEEAAATRTVYLFPSGIWLRHRLILSENNYRPPRVGLLCHSTDRVVGDEYPKMRDDTWMEVELGEIFISGGDDWVDISLKEVSPWHWKRGILVLGIEIRPK